MHTPAGGVPICPRATVPGMRGSLRVRGAGVGMRPFGLQELGEGGGEDGGDFFGVEARDHGFFDGGRGGCGLGGI